MFYCKKFILSVILLFSFILQVNLSATGSSGPTRVIFDHDGSFEDYVAVTAVALAHKKNLINLLGITTSAIGEGYCNGSNGYPQLKTPLLKFNINVNPGVDFSMLTDANGKYIKPFTNFEGTIDGLTQKVLSALSSNVKIYSGCGESTKTITNVPNQYNNPPPIFGGPGVFGGGGMPVPIPNDQQVTQSTLNSVLAKVKLELPYGGLDYLQPCVYHWEGLGLFNDALKPDVTCWAEFSRVFRDEALFNLLPTFQKVLKVNNIQEKSLVQTQKASVFIAQQICKAYRDHEDLILINVGPNANAARAYDKIENNPQNYGCPRGLKLKDLDDTVTSYHMGGYLDLTRIPNSLGQSLNDPMFKDNFDNGNPKTGNYLLNEWNPIWTGGNVYFQDGGYTYGIAHVPTNKAPAACQPATFDSNNCPLIWIPKNQHKNIFHATNIAEFNFFTDANSVDRIFNSKIPARVVPLNVTNDSRIISDPSQSPPGPFGPDHGLNPTYFVNEISSCNTLGAQIVKGILTSHPFVYLTLSFWDTTTVFSVLQRSEDYPAEVIFTDSPSLEITTKQNGNPHTVTTGLNSSTVFRQDSAGLFDIAEGNNPIKISIKADPSGREAFSAEFHKQLAELLNCEI